MSTAKSDDSADESGVSESESDLQPLRLQRNSWGQRELIEHIVDGYFVRHGEAGGSLYAWMVSPREGDVHSVVQDLDLHLRKLGWQASIREGEPYHLGVIPLLGEHPDFGREAQLGLWALAFLFSWVLGASWVSYQNEDLSWTDWAVLKSAVAYFAVPFCAVLFVASTLRRHLLMRAGLDVGHVVPGVVPILVYGGSGVVWPFGIFAIFNQRHMGELPWPDRRTLALSSLVIPITLMAFGLALTLVGLRLTTLIAPSFEEAPLIIQLNPITQFLATQMMPPEEMVLRSAWLHPLALAGQSLMVFGWVLLIPVPGLPGHRLLTAIVGPIGMMQTAVELSQFAVMLLCAIAVLLTTGYPPWLVIFALGAWRLFFVDSASTLPLLVDEAKPFESASRARFLAAGLIALLLAFPGMAAVYDYESWEEGLELDWQESKSLAIGEDWQLELKLSLVGIDARDVSMRAWLEPPRPSWNFSLDCEEEFLLLPAKCSVGSIDPLSDEALFFHATLDNDSAVVPTDLVILVDDGREVKSRVIRLSPESNAVPVSPHWELQPEFGGQLACVNLTFSEDQMAANLTTSALTWSVQSPIDGAIEAGAAEIEVCLSAPTAGKMTLQRDDWGALLPLTLTDDDGGTTTFPLRIAGPLNLLAMPEEGWLLAGKIEQTPDWLGVGSHVAWGDSPLTCTESSLREPGVVEDQITWLPETDSEIRIYDANADIPMLLDLENGGIISSCDADQIPPVSSSWKVTTAPPIVLLVDGFPVWGWVDLPLGSANYELLNLGNETVIFYPKTIASVDANHTMGWGQASGITIPAGGSALVNLTQTFDGEEVMQVAWLSLDEVVGINNSYQLNFAAWCREGADLDPFDGEVDCVVGDGE